MIHVVGPGGLGPVKVQRESVPAALGIARALWAALALGHAYVAAIPHPFSRAQRIKVGSRLALGDRIVREAGIEGMLKSWIVIDNHDIPRIATQLPQTAQRRLVQALQFTLPGAVNLYYGTEVAMEGGDDPEMRGPMRWDRVAAGHPDLAWTYPDPIAENPRIELPSNVRLSALPSRNFLS